MVDEALGNHLKILEIYQNKWKSLQKDYFILIGLSLAFLLIFVYPFMINDFSTFTTGNIRHILNNEIRGLVQADHDVNKTLHTIQNNSSMIGINSDLVNKTKSDLKNMSDLMDITLTELNKERLPNFFNKVNAGFIKNISEYTVTQKNKTDSVLRELENNSLIVHPETTVIKIHNFTSNTTELLKQVYETIIRLEEEASGSNTNIKNIFNDLETPFGIGKLLGFEAVLVFAPMAIVIVFAYCFFKYIELHRYRKRLIKTADTALNNYTESFEPSWPKTDILLHGLIFWIIPFVIYLVLISFNSYLFYYTRLTFLHTYSPILPITSYAGGIIFFSYAIYKIGTTFNWKGNLKLRNNLLVDVCVYSSLVMGLVLFVLSLVPEIEVVDNSALSLISLVLIGTSILCSFAKLTK